MAVDKSENPPPHKHNTKCTPQGETQAHNHTLPPKPQVHMQQVR